MDTTIRDDFADFINNCDLFNSTVLLYDSQGGTLKYEGKGIYDKKPLMVQNEQGQFTYQGHRSILTLSMSELTFMTAYFSLKGYYVVITDNTETKNYSIVNSNYSNNVGSIYCELKEA
jgi:hypothetical protein